MKIPDPTRRFICRICERKTGHWPISNGEIKGSKKNLKGHEVSYQTFQVVQCKDCGSSTFCIDTSIHPGLGVGDSYVDKTEYFPPIPFRIKPSWYNLLAYSYITILDEVYLALDNYLFFLSATGTRTALDQLITDKIGDIGSFNIKVNKLVANKTIDETEKDMLLAVIDAGSASAHRSYRPNTEQVDNMMDILEAIFYKLVIEPEKKKELKKKAEELLRATPKRSNQ